MGSFPGPTPAHWDYEQKEWSVEFLFGEMAARRTENAVPNWSSALRFMEWFARGHEHHATNEKEQKTITEEALQVRRAQLDTTAGTPASGTAPLRGP